MGNKSYYRGTHITHLGHTSFALTDLPPAIELDQVCAHTAPPKTPCMEIDITATTTNTGTLTPFMVIVGQDFLTDPILYLSTAYYILLYSSSWVLVDYTSSRHSEQDDLVLSRDFAVLGQTRILRCEVVEGGRESGTRQQTNEAKI